MATLSRTDIHRPSAIDVLEYSFVGVLYGAEYTPSDGLTLVEHNAQKVLDHMRNTGGSWSTHEHGGSCHICGAHAIYMSVFYHHDTNTYIKTGGDCAEKMGMDSESFRVMASIKKEIASWRDLKAGKLKAENILTEAGLEDAWSIYNFTEDQIESLELINEKGYEWAFMTLRNIVFNLVKYGNISTKQKDFLRNLVEQCLNMRTLKAEKRAAEEARKATMSPVPESDSRVEVKGTIISIKSAGYDDLFSTTEMLVEVEEGKYRLYGSLPRAIDFAVKGDKVSFMAKVSRSNKDEHFGFFNRPTKAEIIK